MKKLLALVLILSLVFCFSACGSSEDNAESDNTILVATQPTFAPFEYTDDDGNIVGFDIDLIKAIAEDQGLTVEIEEMGFDGIVGAVQTGVADIGASGMSITEERLKTVDFSDPYIDASLSIAIQDADTSINSVDDLKDKVCAVQLGSTGATKAEELYEQGMIKEVKTFATVDVLMQELSSGGCDCVITDKPVIQAFIAKNPGKIKLVDEPLVSDSYGFAISKDNQELLEKINAGLANVKKSGKYDELIEKYF